MRICNKCKKEKPLSEYYKDRSNASGREYMCKECKKEYSKTLPDDYRREYYKKNKERLLEEGREWRERNPDYMKEWYRRNPDYVTQRFRENKEELVAYNRKWYHDNLERARELVRNSSSRRRAREAKVINDLTMEEWIEVSNRFNNQCAYCENNTDITLDHVIPIFKGGGHTKSNVVPACKSCNSSKQARDVEEWYKEQDFYDENNLNKILKGECTNVNQIRF